MHLTKDLLQVERHDHERVNENAWESWSQEPHGPRLAEQVHRR